MCLESLQSRTGILESPGKRVLSGSTATPGNSSLEVTVPSHTPDEGGCLVAHDVLELKGVPEGLRGEGLCHSYGHPILFLEQFGCLLFRTCGFLAKHERGIGIKLLR